MSNDSDLTPETQTDPDSAYEENLAYGRWLFSQPCVFDLSLASMDYLPSAERMEVAFAGRSNVGKSSLINALINQRNMARTSATPGRTQQLNFFNLSDTLCLVDLPGYGYAKAPKQSIEAWTRLTRAYLKGRATLARVYILIDCRHGLKQQDQAIMAVLDKVAISYQLVLTKMDKVSPSAQQEILQATAVTASKHPACHPTIHMTSAVKKQGLDKLKADIAMLMRQVFPIG